MKIQSLSLSLCGYKPNWKKPYLATWKNPSKNSIEDRTMKLHALWAFDYSGFI